MDLLTNTQASVAKAIINIFETSAVLGEYSKVTLIPGDTGHLTYGRSQTTLGSGNLHKLIAAYVGRCGARFAADFEPFLPELENPAPDFVLDTHTLFKNLLRAAADDPVMRDTQDEFFDEVYWDSAVRIAKRDGLAEPLAVAAVYDSVVHGSWSFIRRRTLDHHGTVEDLGDRQWITRYVEERHSWLANHSRSDLRATTYRMEAIRRLIDQDQWPLDLPLVVRGIEINTEALAATPPNVYDGPEPRSRVVGVMSPMLRGLDVRLAQLALSRREIDIAADGIFGRVSRDHVRDFQIAQGLPVTGVLDVHDFETLGL